ncbi:hypothetical protein D3C76_188250 [compost metagenome]
MWADCRNVVNQQVTASNKEAMRHLLKTGNQKTYIGTMHGLQGQAAMSWAVLEDWESRVSL